MTRALGFLVSLLIIISLSFNHSLATFSFTNAAFAQEVSTKEATESEDIEQKEKKIEYQLPYPGLLPDNPLYFLKALRDAIIDFLISDPLKKADFYLLQADKRLNSGLYLVNEKNNYELAESTISKGENYFEKAIGKIKEAKNQGADIDPLKNRLLLSSQKHQEVISDLMQSAEAQTKEKFNILLKRSERYEKEAELLLPK